MTDSEILNAILKKVERIAVAAEEAAKSSIQAQRNGMLEFQLLLKEMDKQDG